MIFHIFRSSLFRLAIICLRSNRSNTMRMFGIQIPRNVTDESTRLQNLSSCQNCKHFGLIMLHVSSLKTVWHIYIYINENGFSPPFFSKFTGKMESLARFTAEKNSASWITDVKFHFHESGKYRSNALFYPTFTHKKHWAKKESV